MSHGVSKVFVLAIVGNKKISQSILREWNLVNNMIISIVSIKIFKVSYVSLLVSYSISFKK